MPVTPAIPPLETALFSGNACFAADSYFLALTVGTETGLYTHCRTDRESFWLSHQIMAVQK